MISSGFITLYKLVCFLPLTIFFVAAYFCLNGHPEAIPIVIFFALILLHLFTANDVSVTQEKIYVKGLFKKYEFDSGLFERIEKSILGYGCVISFKDGKSFSFDISYNYNYRRKSFWRIMEDYDRVVEEHVKSIIRKENLNNL